MEPALLIWIVNFIWGFADDILRVTLPMTVLRRIDRLLEPTQKSVLADCRITDTTITPRRFATYVANWRGPSRASYGPEGL
jgi:type I restriction-modification system DNA methylase subunit